MRHRPSPTTQALDTEFAIPRHKRLTPLRLVVEPFSSVDDLWAARNVTTVRVDLDARLAASAKRLVAVGQAASLEELVRVALIREIADHPARSGEQYGSGTPRLA